ncbi:MAG: hypothetical protein Harvfovirus21_21 [Harvfovirus sp.]|uniref:Uncharacterized protein n=1 Tax=Harvfovirus sp. TaxID=2487768 RepID=A0A3G5A417_9VIRU|nr:MAG: hypothetical protein Harvfovirus21_21 [Harvfovirus sp.]
MAGMDLYPALTNFVTIPSEINFTPNFLKKCDINFIVTASC